jgi:hypothetical protein
LPALTANLCDDLEDVRRLWFHSCLESLKETAGYRAAQPLSDDLARKTACTVKAYQATLLSRLLREHAYLAPSVAEEFVPLLCEQILGEELHDCILYYKRYSEAGEGQQLSLFSCDVAQHFLGCETPLPESLVVSLRCCSLLVDLTHMCVAKTFDDHETVRTLEDRLRNGYENKGQDRRDNPLAFLRGLYGGGNEE